MTTAATTQPARREMEVISLVGFSHGVSHFFHLMIPPLFPWLMSEVGLGFTEVGVTTAVFFTVSGIGQALAGFVVDRLGARRVLLAGMIFFARAAAVLSGAQNYIALLFAAGLAGLGNSVFHPADFTLLNRNVTPNRLGHAFSVHGLSGNIGWALGPIFMTGLAMTAGWRVAACAASGVALVAFTLILLRRDAMTESALEAEHHAPDTTLSTLSFLGSPAVWMCFLFFFLATMAFGGLQNYGPSALQKLYGMSLAAGASSLTAYLLAGAAGIVVGGFLVARGQAHDRHIGVVLTAAAVLTLVIASGNASSGGVMALMAGAGFFHGMAGPSRDMLVRRAATSRFGKKSFGRVYGFVYSGLDIGLAVAPLLFGPLMDASRPALALIGVALLQGLAVAAALYTGRNLGN